MRDREHPYPDPTVRKEVERRLGEARRAPLPHPWDGLEEELAAAGEPALPLVAYGSLVHRDSAALTLSAEALRTFRPVVVFGARRIFNYRMPVYVPRYGFPATPEHRAALNVRATRDPDDSFNGVLLEIPPADLPSLQKRERAYDLVRLPCADWEAPDAPIGAAYVLSAPDGSASVDATILPHLKYLSICREGARRFGEEFLRFWNETTFLADGETLVGAP